MLFVVDHLFSCPAAAGDELSAPLQDCFVAQPPGPPLPARWTAGDVPPRSPPRTAGGFSVRPQAAHSERGSCPAGRRVTRSSLARKSGHPCRGRGAPGQPAVETSEFGASGRGQRTSAGMNAGPRQVDVPPPPPTRGGLVLPTADGPVLQQFWPVHLRTRRPADVPALLGARFFPPRRGISKSRWRS